MSDRTASGSILGATLMVTGCCVGAGMLGLPLITAAPGFVPASFAFCLVWLYMLTSGLLLLEICLSFKSRVNLASLSRSTLGKGAEITVFILFIFLFYSLLLAYLSGGGEIISYLCDTVATLPSYMGTLLFFASMGGLLALRTKGVDVANRLFTFGLIGAFLLLIILGFGDVDSSRLGHQEWSLTYPVLPVAVVSFGFHNLVPTLTNYLGRDRTNLIRTFSIGSFLPLLLYFLWELLILGVATEGELSNEGAIRDILASTSALPIVHPLLTLFTLCAIASSYLTVGLSCIHFLRDALQLSDTPANQWKLWLLVAVPPLIIALTYPSIFLHALGIAGAYGAVVLFGIIPTLMAWKQRSLGLPDYHVIVPGGKPVLVLLMLLSFVIIFSQIAVDFT